MIPLIVRLDIRRRLKKLPDLSSLGNNKKQFHLEINSFEDFISFVAIIRGKESDADKLKDLADRMATKRKELSNAVEGEENG